MDTCDYSNEPVGKMQAFLYSWRTISLSRKTPVHVVSELVHQDTRIQQNITTNHVHYFLKLCEKASKLQYFKKDIVKIIHYQIFCYINK